MRSGSGQLRRAFGTETGMQISRPETLRRGYSFGLRAESASDLIRQVQRGFSFSALQRLCASSHLDISLLAEIIGIPERTLARRRTAGKLAPDESERLFRIARIFEDCVALFEGDVAAAVNWLETPKRVLENRNPLEYTRTEPGAREVEDLIGRLEHGVFS
jgi:putative toxin-antitoxin system antitoxin component (TIGR02293 family)